MSLKIQISVDNVWCHLFVFFYVQDPNLENDKGLGFSNKEMGEILCLVSKEESIALTNNLPPYFSSKAVLIFEAHSEFVGAPIFSLVIFTASLNISGDISQVPTATSLSEYVSTTIFAFLASLLFK